MMKTIFKIIFCLAISVGLYAQYPSTFPYSKPLPNDNSTGTTQFKLVKINSSGNAVLTSTSDTSGFAGVAVSNAGTSGNVWVAFSGLVPLVMDGTATVDHYVLFSAATAGDGKDSGATTYPVGVGTVVGRVQTGCTGAQCTAFVDIFPGEVRSDGSAATPSFSGGNATLVGPREYYACTGTCSITVPVPVAGYEFCIYNADNISTVITLVALGSSARYETTARTSYGTAGTGTAVSGGAAADKLCLHGLDSTHYETLSYNGTWTVN